MVNVRKSHKMLNAYEHKRSSMKSSVFPPDANISTKGQSAVVFQPLLSNLMNISILVIMVCCMPAYNTIPYFDIYTLSYKEFVHVL